MPVIRRKAPPAPKAPESPTAAVESPIPASPLLNEKEARQYLKCSKHEIRELVTLKILKPVPYLHGRIKPWRFLRSAIDQHIADQVKVP